MTQLGSDWKLVGHENRLWELLRYNSADHLIESHVFKTFADALDYYHRREAGETS